MSLEGRQRELTAELEKPETYEAGGAAMDLNRELLGITSEMDRLTKEWESLAEKAPA
jgi:ATP-binding cassette subfamily F protein 3